MCVYMCISIYLFIKRTKNKHLLKDPYVRDKQGSLYRLSVHLSITANPQATFFHTDIS